MSLISWIKGVIGNMFRTKDAKKAFRITKNAANLNVNKALSISNKHLQYLYKI